MLLLLDKLTRIAIEMQLNGSLLKANGYWKTASGVEHNFRQNFAGVSPFYLKEQNTRRYRKNVADNFSSIQTHVTFM